MKRILAFSTMLVAVMLVLTGCSSSASQSTSSQAGATTAKGGSARRPDFGQPQRPADLRGVVTSVVGNEVTVLKLALNTGRRASSTPGTTGNGSTTANSNTPSFSLGGAGGAGGARGGAGGFGGGAGGRGGAGGAGGFGGGTSTTDRATMIANLKAMSTGSETLIVPVGIKMMKSGIDPTTQKRTMVEANLSDITADKMINVWLNASVTDQKVAEFVLIN